MAATFSYAQAAKGISSPVSVSKPASGSATPAKDDASKAPITSVAQVNSWADDADTESSTEQPTTNDDSPMTSSKPTKPAEPLETSTADLDSLSASTVTKDDDVSSQPNMSSESTWDNKSQASTSVDKTVEPVQKTSEKSERGEKGRKGKKGEKKEAEKEKEPPKPLKEAPLPAVNIWQQRADQQKSQVKPVASPLTNGAPKKSSPEGRPTSTENKPKGRREDKAASLRKDTRGDTEKKGAKGRPYDKDVKPTSSAMPLPPNQDQESWPTPETAVDEDRKKAQEKNEKERKDNAPNGTSGKHEWVKVPYTPSVVFNTPLPNAANPRRGGRPGGRGGAQSGGRPAGFGTNGVATSEKDAPAPDAVLNGEQPKREVNGVAGDASPKSKRSGSAASPTLKEQVPAVNGEKSLKGPGAASFEPEAPKRASTMTEVSNQSGAIPRQYAGRPGKGRRGDFNGSERKKDSDASPTKEDGSESERRPFEGPSGVHSKQNRYNNSYAGGRDRPRGGGRGGRGGFANGHQFANGHAQQGSGSFSMGPGSPTTFSPGNSTFFTAPQGKFGRNSHRSQSVADSYRYPAFQGAPQMAPVNTYNMYDYNMIAPVSTVPYSPYGVDQFALFQMITTQVEYYFSVDNLLKDMYLRKHMDSQGFVSLDFIAAFNRIKNLTTDIELLKLVCQQSSHVQYRTGEDGRDRLRRREGWEQWVLNMTERDESAQNEGPKELHNPPVPNPAGFDQSNPPQYPTTHTGYGNDVSYPQHNPFVPSAPQDAAAAPTEDLTNGTSPEGVNGTAVTNGQPIEESTKAVSAEPDSFSDAQIESLTVIVRKQNKTLAALRPSASRTFSNGSLDSKNDGVDELDDVLNCRSRAHGVATSHDSVECGFRQSPKSGANISTPPVRLYWVKDQEHPVGSVPSDITHESYFHLRSRALQQRQNTPFGSICYDMEVLYQFWSHFLIRNFNTRMYEEFRQLAFEDALRNMTDVGLSSLIKLYSQSLLSSQTVVRHRVAYDYVALVQSEDDDHCPAFTQLRSDLSSNCPHSGSQQRLRRLLTDDLLELLQL